jgi:hypothetical protein
MTVEAHQRCRLDYMHSANPETPIEETMRALAELKAYVYRGGVFLGVDTDERVLGRARSSTLGCHQSHRPHFAEQSRSHP